MPAPNDPIFESRDESFKEAYKKGKDLWMELNRNLTELASKSGRDWTGWKVGPDDFDFLYELSSQCDPGELLNSLDLDREENNPRGRRRLICSDNYVTLNANTSQGIPVGHKNKFGYLNSFSNKAGAVVAIRNHGQMSYKEFDSNMPILL